MSKGQIILHPWDRQFRDVALETSAASRLMKTPSRAEALAELVTAKGSARLSLSMTTAQELLAPRSDENVLGQAQRLATLLRILHPVLVLTMPDERLVQEESGRPLEGAPFAENGVARFVEQLDECVSRRDVSRHGLGQSRDDHWASKVRVRQLMSAERELFNTRFREKGLKANAVGAALRDYSADQIPVETIALQLKALRVTGLDPAVVVADKERYHALRARAGLMRLAMYGDVVPSDVLNQHAYLAAVASDTNNYFDARVAASAAYADDFIVEDGRFRERCVQCARTGIVRFRSLSLSDFERLIAMRGESPHILES